MAVRPNSRKPYSFSSFKPIGNKPVRDRVLRGELSSKEGSPMRRVAASNSLRKIGEIK